MAKNYVIIKLFLIIDFLSFFKDIIDFFDNFNLYFHSLQLLDNKTFLVVILFFQ
jgi:hypothetical protein